MKSTLVMATAVVVLLSTGCRGRTTESTPPPAPAPAPQATVATPAPAPTPPAVAPAPPAPVTPAAPPARARKPAARAAARPPRASAPPEPATPPPVATSGREVPAVPTPAVPVTRELTMAAGTTLQLELLTPVSSESAQVETAVRARLVEPVLVNGEIGIPIGATLTGGVVDVARSGRVEGRARLAFAFDHAEWADTRVALRTNTLQYEAEATKGEDVAKIGGGAIGGAIIGGILGGAKGAAKGAAIGGAAGAGVVMVTRGDEVTLAAGTPLAATLATPLTVTVPR